ncbi:hypothetical protein T07_10304 [Trichinella nelsoni]|uniref:Uncharacterized protein n=1 Tax=Trichinella nelsoni TaxID=6336 RepID=A0A0V0SKM9_9BILA|nr:hypothetical protein T07_10304 [Trichinella nelsoni]
MSDYVFAFQWHSVGASCRLARQLLHPKQSQLTATITPVANFEEKKKQYVRVSTFHKVYLNCANFVDSPIQVEI